MFTVIIAEQDHLDQIQEYKAFLAPFLKNKEVALCRWIPGADELNDAIPDLQSTVAGHALWRALVLCDKEGIHQRNPFDLVSCDIPPRPDKTDDAEADLRGMDVYLESVAAIKRDAYQKAAGKPLTRLGTWLCDDPMISSGVPQIPEGDIDEMIRIRPHEYAEYKLLQEYHREAVEKAEIRKEIRGSVKLTIEKPAEFIAMSLRTIEETEDMLISGWNEHEEQDYSRFWERNLYFERMRFMIYDIPEEKHSEYPAAYLSFLYSLLILASNDTGDAGMRPNRVYRLESRNNDKVLGKLLGRYDNKLDATFKLLEVRKDDLRHQYSPELTDKEARDIFFSSMPVYVMVGDKDSTEKLYVERDRIGLASDCPGDQAAEWGEKRHESEKAFQLFLKQPRKAIRRASSEIHMKKKVDYGMVSQLNEFQIDDLSDHTALEEVDMVSHRIFDVNHTEQYEKRLEEADQNVKKTIEKRMTRKTVLILGGSVLLVCLLAMIPAMINPAGLNVATIGTAFMLMAGAVGIMTLVGIVSLFCLRLPVRRAYKDYNRTMRENVRDIHRSMDMYSDYLTHACNVMRGFDVMNYLQEHEGEGTYGIRLLEKHQQDILETRTELREIFGKYLPQKNMLLEEDDEAPDTFDYDFTRPVDYKYPILFSADQQETIQFLRSGKMIEVPVGFIESLTLRREELYE